MMDYGTHAVGLKIHRQHVIAAMLAALLSVCAHVALMVNFPDVPLGFKYVLPTAHRTVPRRDPLKLGDVTAQPPEAPPVVERMKFIEAAIAASAVQGVEEMAARPDRAAIEPPSSAASDLATETVNLAGPGPIPARTEWEPRGEILMIEKRLVNDPVAALDRKVIPRIERVGRAPDIVAPVTRNVATAAVNPKGRTVVDSGVTAKPGRVNTTEAPVADIGAGPSNVAVRSATFAPADLFMERPEQVTSYLPLEKLLRARMYTYTTLRDFKYGYFRIEITRVNEGVLPPLPKDIIFVQDCSASMTEQRVVFCRQGLAAALPAIGDEDRFNLVRFNDRAVFCFPDWSAKTPDALAKAQQFIEGMVAGGETDILASLNALNDLKIAAGRPVVVLLITDGRSTTGVTAASAIIREFSRQNDGKVSVFTMGTVQTANSYLLDILSYCNRGDTRIVESGRWGIPEAVAGLMREVSRPVLANVNFRFPEGSETEVYPVLTMNLFIDRPLVLYGRYRKGAEHVIFQAAGDADRTRCDMIFDLPLGTAERSRDKSLRSDWARQKVYHLIGQYARDGDPGILREIETTAADYGVAIPHRGEF